MKQMLLIVLALAFVVPALGQKTPHFHRFSTGEVKRCGAKHNQKKFFHKMKIKTGYAHKRRKHKLENI